jgi:hypothetical protein
MVLRWRAIARTAGEPIQFDLDICAFGQQILQRRALVGLAARWALIFRWIAIGEGAIE